MDTNLFTKYFWSKLSLIQVLVESLQSSWWFWGDQLKYWTILWWLVVYLVVLDVFTNDFWLVVLTQSWFLVILNGSLLVLNELSYFALISNDSWYLVPGSYRVHVTRHVMFLHILYDIWSYSDILIHTACSWNLGFKFGKF